MEKERCIDRRGFLGCLGATGFFALGIDECEAATPASDKDPVGVLVDTTQCLGCRRCEFVCAKAHGLPRPEAEPDFSGPRKTSPTQLSAINRYKVDPEVVGEDYVFVKRQCMHCRQPACASACLTKAMLKTKEGPVVWRSNKCMGCRFCMVSCPFDVPKFEYDKAVPRIQKCDLCASRLKEGKKPACVENCPAEALTFGPRSKLIEIARKRIQEEPETYVHEIYGEHEAGGTSWLYLSAVPFKDIGLPTTLGTTPYPALTKEFLYGVPLVLALAPAFLLGLSQATRPDNPSHEQRVDR